jgi:hypothetical protein
MKVVTIASVFVCDANIMRFHPPFLVSLLFWCADCDPRPYFPLFSDPDCKDDSDRQRRCAGAEAGSTQGEKDKEKGVVCASNEWQCLLRGRGESSCWGSGVFFREVKGQFRGACIESGCCMSSKGDGEAGMGVVSRTLPPAYSELASLERWTM